MRHAKSSWKQLELNDLDRPLLEKGLKRTRIIITQLQERKAIIDFIISSHAVRAAETAAIIAHAFHVDENNIRTEKKIYSSDSDNFLDIFFDLPVKVSHVMMVGHNPAITNFANNYLENKIDYLPTSGVVAITFDTDQWENLPEASYKVEYIIFPKMFQ